MNIVEKLPFDARGNMLRRATKKDPDIVWRANGPIDIRLILHSWSWTNTSPYFLLRPENTENIVYMFFDDFMRTLFHKPCVNRTFEGIWIGWGHAGVYGLRMHPIDKHCPKDYETINSWNINKVLENM